jgi:integrase
MTVILRQRKKGSKISLYLEYYSRGKRVYEYLKLYLLPEPEKGRLTTQQKETNKQNLSLAEAIRAQRHVEIQNGIYGFKDKEKLRSSFLEYFKAIADGRRDSLGNHCNWQSTFKYLKAYANLYHRGGVTFEMLNKEWIEGFRNYLQHEAKSKLKKPLSPNTQFGYYSKLVAALKQAVKDGILLRNPADEVDNIRQVETHREFLTLEELKAAFDAPCDNELLKSAFLFSAFTGLRWSDVSKLTWGEVQYAKEHGYYLRYRQEKTGSTETLPISDDARSFLGEGGEAKEVVFKDLKYSAWNNLKLREWMMRAGILKPITFHCARHTYATLQITAGTDIFTVAKLLGHKNLKNTQIYAKIVDEKKREAANKISFGLGWNKKSL